MLKHLDVNLIG